jgi:DNA-binding transcriptional LysR family regulator
MRYGVSDQIEQLLYEDAVEIGMFSRQPKLRGLVSEHYGSSNMVIAAAAGHRLTRRRSISLEEIAGEPFILREPQSSGGELVRRYFAKRRLSLNVAIELSSHESIKVAVAEGLGIAAVARRWLNNEIALKQIAVLKVPDFKLAIDHRVVHRQEKRLSQAATNFLQFLRDLKPELSRLLS